MPGRQAHGRSLMGGGGAKNKQGKNRSKSRAQKAALNAFSIAEDQFADRQKRTPRNRELDAQLQSGRGKRSRDEDDDEEGDDFGDDDDEAEDGPPRKMRRGGGKEEDVEYGSDSSGNEWRIGVGADDDDSEIDSDEAFGESDAERFEDYTFRGSRKNQQAESDDDDDLDDADGASLGSDAIDLAQALDMSMSEDDDPAADDQDDDASTDDSGSDDDSSASEVSSEDEDMDDDISDSGVNAWVSKFSGVKDTDEEAPIATKKPKIGLKELGLLQVKDPQLKKSVKLMGKEQKSSKPQKLEVPLAKRQQAKLDREVAREKTNQTLDRWTETVKQNRRAEHLVFPLPQTETGLAKHDNTELQPLNLQATGNELESTILAIMEESGLGPSAAKEEAEMKGPDGEKLTKEERQAIVNEKRRLRELKSREEKKAKRIAKIKSKAYHRVHRKQRERDDMKAHEAMVEAGEIDSDEEKEARDRQRAMERMGARHKESKWAKMSNKAGRAAWDEDVRVGIADMARRDEELRRRVEGKSAKTAAGDDDSDSDYSADSEDVDDRKRLLQKLNSLDDGEDDQPRSALMNMEFMRKAEAARKKANDETIAQIRRELASDGEEGEDSDEGPEEIGRKKYGQHTEKKKPSESLLKPSKSRKDDSSSALQATRDTIAAATASTGFSAKMGTVANNNVTAGAWSQAATSGPQRKQKGSKKSSSSADVLEINADSVAVAPAAPAAVAQRNETKAKKAKHGLTAGREEVSSDDDEAHMPVQFREQDLIDRAFGGLDVVADFEAEKAAIAEEDDDKVVDNTLPGWGSWVGDGVSAREKKRHQGRFLVKQEGVKAKELRKDAKLKDAIINEKRVKKTEKYLATQLPHMYENKTQYERALRLPVGPEWVTKETFQEATKPRIMLKQGIIAPMAKPTH